MILADKIIKERKKLGLSQEELAEKMNVSRQAVSKWEGNQCVPEIDKILQMSSLFGVTTDYLLKDQIEAAESVSSAPPAEKVENTEKIENTKQIENTENTENESPDAIVLEKGGKTLKIPAENYREPPKEARTVTLKEAENYLAERKIASRNVAIGTFLCIIAVIPLLLLAGFSEANFASLPEDTAGLLGIIFLLVIIAPAVGLFVYTGAKNSPYEFLEKEPFETESGAAEMVRQQENAFAETYTKLNITGTIFCVLSPIPLFIGSFTNNDLTAIVSLCVTLLIAGIGAVLFILAGVRHESMQRLLKEGDYSETAKKTKSIKGIISAIYWLVMTAAYLLVHFLSGNMGNGWKSGGSWVIWPVAAVFFPVVLLVFEIVQRKKNGDEQQ